MRNTIQIGGLPTSALALIGVNLLPLCGVLFAGWDVFSVVLLYWLETAVIGGINVLRILTASGDLQDMGRRMLEQSRGRLHDDQAAAARAQLDQIPAGCGHSMKLFLVPFFCVHFGGFMSVHLVFIFVLLGGGGAPSIASPSSAFSRVGDVISPLMLVSLLGLLASHLFSFFTNFIGKGEFRGTTPHEQMMRPYGRVVVMHIAILFGAFATIALGQQIAVLLLLIAGKIIIDLKFHMRDHVKAQAKVAERDGALIFNPGDEDR